MLVRKIDPEWFPSEKTDLKVGETIHLDNPHTLINEGKVAPAEEVQGFICDVCGKTLKSKIGLISHARTHA